MFQKFFAKLAGKFLAKKLDLQEDKNMESKKWWTSKTLWAAVVGGIIGIYTAIATIVSLPPIPEWVYTLLASLGLWGLRTAEKKID